MINSVAEYESIVEHEDNEVRRKANFEEASEQTWHAILEKRPDLAEEVAMNKKLPPGIIDQLIVSGSSRSRSLVAMKRSLTHSQFQKLSSDQDESIRAMIASNKKTPTTILEALANDECVMVSNAARLQIQNRQNVS